MTDLPIKIRPAQTGDMGLIVTSWLGSYQPHVPWMPKDDFYRYYRKFIHKLLDRKNVECHVACNPEVEGHVFGWMCGSNFEGSDSTTVLHYVFVKSAYRRLGIGSKLFPAKKLDPYFESTHWTIDGYNAGFSVRYRPDKLSSIKEKTAHEGNRSPTKKHV